MIENEWIASENVVDGFFVGLFQTKTPSPKDGSPAKDVKPAAKEARTPGAAKPPTPGRPTPPRDLNTTKRDVKSQEKKTTEKKMITPNKVKMKVA